jgi:hypothetical protein
LRASAFDLKAFERLPWLIYDSSSHFRPASSFASTCYFWQTFLELPLLKKAIRDLRDTAEKLEASLTQIRFCQPLSHLRMADNPQIDPSWVPDAAQSGKDFSESSFFKINGPNSRLPSPAEVRALSGENETHPQPAPVRFAHLGLIVKFGYDVTVYEAQCLSVMKRVLCNEVTVPEVYGWRVDSDQVFIYMQLIQGPTLKERWDSLDVSDKTAVCGQLRRIMTCLRRVEQDPHDSFIGML